MKISSSLDFRSKDAAAAGCLSGILRRFRCGSLRSNACREGEERRGIDTGFGQEWNVERKIMPSPGIVARLMGLESAPVYPSAASELVGRSWSTNSLESWPGFLSEGSHSPQFRTSQSFREVPTYLRQENEDFLVLSFTSDDGEEAIASNGMRRRMDFREMKERKRSERKARVAKESRTERRITEKKNKNKRVEQKHCHKENLPLILDTSGIVKKKLRNSQKKVEPECSSQNSSPVSVLDLTCNDDDCCIHTNSPSTGEQKQPIQQSSRRKVTPNFENANCLSPSIGPATFSRDGGMRSVDKERKRSRNQEQTCPDFSDIGGEICRLGEEDLKNSTWISNETSRPEIVGDIAADLGLQMLDLLLYEAVCELSNYIT